MPEGSPNSQLPLPADPSELKHLLLVVNEYLREVDTKLDNLSKLCVFGDSVGMRIQNDIPLFEHDRQIGLEMIALVAGMHVLPDMELTGYLDYSEAKPTITEAASRLERCAVEFGQKIANKDCDIPEARRLMNSLLLEARNSLTVFTAPARQLRTEILAKLEAKETASQPSYVRQQLPDGLRTLEYCLKLANDFVERMDASIRDITESIVYLSGLEIRATRGLFVPDDLVRVLEILSRFTEGPGEIPPELIKLLDFREANRKLGQCRSELEKLTENIAERELASVDSIRIVREAITTGRIFFTEYMTPVKALRSEIVAKMEAIDGKATQRKSSRRTPDREKADYEAAQRENEIAEAWQRAKQCGSTKKEFIKDHGYSGSLKDLDKLLKKLSMRKKRAKN